MTEKFTLYTKDNCSACEKVKDFIRENNLEVKIVNVTNDLVRVMNIKSALEAKQMRVSFPVLEIEDNVTRNLLNPSDAIIAYLQGTISGVTL